MIERICHIDNELEDIYSCLVPVRLGKVLFCIINFQTVYTLTCWIPL